MKTNVKHFNFSKVLMTLIAAVLILSSLFTFTACGGKEDASSGQSPTSSVSAEEAKVSITFKLIKDGQTTEFPIETSKKYLADALVEAKLVEYASDGYYTTINGITADWNTDKSWWCITIGGEMSMKGLNEIELTDGGSYEATYTIN